MRSHAGQLASYLPRWLALPLLRVACAVTGGHDPCCHHHAECQMCGAVGVSWR